MNAIKMPQHLDDDNGPKTIALIDDHQDFLDVTSILLKKEGYEVFATTDSDDFIDFVSENLIDLAIMDVEMPKISGFDLCKKLQDDPDSAYIPVIFLTGLSDPLDQFNGYFSGACDYITKPFEKEHLLGKVEELLTL